MMASSVYGRLHDRINKFDVTNIDAICNDIDELVKQVIQNNSSRPPDVFYDFCLKLFDRVYGENATLCDTQPAWVRSPLGGGWLKKLTAMSIYPSRAHGSQTDNNLSSISISITRRLIKILEYKSELQILLRKNNKDYESKISLLPIKARLCILKHSAYSSVQSDGQNIYFQLLKHPIQTSLSKVITDDATLTLDSFEYFLICLLRYPTTDSNVVLNSQNYTDSNKLQVQRSAAERSIVGVLRKKGSKEWLKLSPYLSLLKRYFDDLIKLSDQNNIHNNHDNSIELKFNSPDLKFHTKIGQLFICLACEYWMDTATIVRSHTEYSKYCISRNQNRTFTVSHLITALTNIITNQSYFIPLFITPSPVPHPITALTDSVTSHSHPTEVTTLDSSGSAWNHTMLQIPRFGSSMTLLINQMGTPSLRTIPPEVKPLKVPDTSNDPTQPLSRFRSCPPCVAMIQQPIFDMLRCIFGRGEVDSVTFGLAVDLWLIYLQPWKLQAEVQYSKKWDFYVAANLHFYTTLLASFFRVTARIDLTPTTVQGIINFKSLENVLNLFNSNLLLSTIENLVFDFVTWYSPNRQKVEDNHPTGVSTISQLTAVKTHHYHLFPDRCIDRLDYYGIVNVRTHSKNDGIVLISTIQKLKNEFKVRKNEILADLEKMVSGGFLSNLLKSIESIWSAVYSFIFNMDIEEKEKKDYCERLTLSGDRIRYILEIPESALPFFSPKGISGAHSDGSPEGNIGDSTCLRNEYDGKLTQIQLSKFLNTKYDLPRDQLAAKRTFRQIIQIALKNKWSALPQNFIRSFRFNLRFLSQYRIFSSIIIYFSLYISFQAGWIVNVPLLFFVLVVSGFFFYHGSF